MMHFSNRFAVFLAAALILLTGAETEVAGRSGGTLPLRGDGTLPLRMPSEGTLPLIMTGTAAVPGSAAQDVPELVMSMDIDISNADSSGDEGTEKSCADVFGPIWSNVKGEGLMIVGSEELSVAEVCLNKLSEEVAIIATSHSEQSEDSPNHCFVTGLKTVEDLSLVSGQVTCTKSVSGAKDYKFRLESQG